SRRRPCGRGHLRLPAKRIPDSEPARLFPLSCSVSLDALPCPLVQYNKVPILPCPRSIMEMHSPSKRVDAGSNPAGGNGRDTRLNARLAYLSALDSAAGKP